MRDRGRGKKRRQGLWLLPSNSMEVPLEAFFLLFIYFITMHSGL